MLRSYRGVILALGLILSGPSHAQPGEDNQSKTEQDSANQLARIAAAIEKQPITTAADRGCPPSQDNRQSDLCAQWKAADAAAESAQWALWSFWLTGLGLLVGSGTLFAAWRAAHWAKKAAEHTETGANQSRRAADAAEETLSLTRFQTQQTLRAYVGLEKMTISMPLMKNGEEMRQFEAVFKNYGSSPALNFRFGGATIVTNQIDFEPSSDPRIKPDAFDRPGSMLAQGGAIVRGLGQSSVAELMSIIGKEKHLFVALYCAYFVAGDAEEKVWRQLYRFETYGHESSSEFTIASLNYAFEIAGDWHKAT
ncbi:hypothetical protein GGQ88_003264 [Novosphingobium hassiacum]|uniref:Uncharacterized protein n=1 Tax=Novosphingobium hassiacum TaxID=173676 RepID=A0A7W6A0L7_9SPHN|nr:hypothetical protein [Novosphingobium hassiacum]MBB3861974.1 hypothetical protein [Novosphingobium hassiacum]